MREIKFRAWDKKENHFIKDGFIIDHRGDEIGEYSYRSQSFVWNDTEPNYILMQYTGLKDKNGKEIYEGDIVRISFQKNNPAGVQDDRWYTKITTVEWADGYAGFNPFCYQEHYQNNANLLEVIGNIYENSELLKKEGN